MDGFYFMFFSGIFHTSLKLCVSDFTVIKAVSRQILLGNMVGQMEPLRMFQSVDMRHILPVVQLTNEF